MLAFQDGIFSSLCVSAGLLHQLLLSRVDIVVQRFKQMKPQREKTNTGLAGRQRNRGREIHILLSSAIHRVDKQTFQENPGHPGFQWEWGGLCGSRNFKGHKCIFPHTCVYHVYSIQKVLVNVFVEKEGILQKVKKTNFFKQFSYLSYLCDYSHNKAEGSDAQCSRLTAGRNLSLINCEYVSAYCSFLGGWEIIAVFRGESVLNFRLYST